MTNFLGGVNQPFSLDVKVGEMEIVFPSMPKGEIVGNMAMQVVIDGNQIRQSNKQSDDRATNKWE